jgi:predicted enzyme related to lactoylglutathione lyase
MAPSSETEGRFVWYDLMTTDPEAAQSFYTKLIGWSTEGWDAPTPYTMWKNEDQSLGGVMTLPDEAKQAGAPPHWLGYIHTPDVDQTLKTAEENQAKVLVPAQDIPEVGRFAVVSDPQGAAFAIFSPKGEAPGHAGEPQVGEVSWHELNTSDHENAWGFYETLFGWKKLDAMDMGEMGMYQMFTHAGSDLPMGGMFNKPKEVPGPPFWLYYARVDDVHKSVEDVKKLGGQVLNGPMEVPGGDHIAQCMDPQGAAFALHSTKN